MDLQETWDERQLLFGKNWDKGNPHLVLAQNFQNCPLFRHLLKCYEAGQRGRQLSLTMSYLGMESGASNIQTEQDCGDLGQMVTAFRQRAFK